MTTDFIDWLHAEAPERRVYRQPPLALALCQIRFETQFGLGEDRVGLFQQAISSHYPIGTKESLANVQVQIGGDSAESRVEGIIPHWKFVDRSGNWTVTLTNDFISLETRAYTYFEEFLERLEQLIHSLSQTIRPQVCPRIGVRYINEIRSPDLDWTTTINPSLLGFVSIPQVASSVKQAVQVVSIETKGVSLNLQHGILPTGTVVAPLPGITPDPTAFYLIDLDVFKDFVAPNILDLDAKAVCEYVKTFHATISEFFRWATSDSYRATLGIQEGS